MGVGFIGMLCSPLAIVMVRFKSNDTVCVFVLLLCAFVYVSTCLPRPIFLLIAAARRSTSIFFIYLVLISLLVRYRTRLLAYHSSHFENLPRLTYQLSLKALYS